MTTTTPKPHRLSPALLLLLGALGMGVLGGCRNEMFDMEYGEPLEQSNFFPDKRMSRTLVPGTVARGHLREDSLYYFGREAGADATVFPMEIDEAALRRGKERYNVFCSPCHGRTGRGDGMIVQRGMKQPPSFHDQRLKDAPPGYFFNVITNGFGVMYPYGSRVDEVDRWKIIAYVRALQRSGIGGGTAVSAAAPAATDTVTPPQGGTDTASGATTSTGTQANNGTHN